MNISELESAIGMSIPFEVPVVLIAYMALMLLIGLWAAKKVRSSEDWFVGGREMGPWITALAHGSSSVGGGMYIAGPQFGWEAGASALWAAPGDALGPLLNFGIIARRMRRYTDRTKSLTIPDFFGHRYYSKGVKLLSVIILLVAMVISLVVEYLALGVLIIRKYKLLNAPPELADHVTERLYKPMYVIRFHNTQLNEDKYKVLDSLSGDLEDIMIS